MKDLTNLVVSLLISKQLYGTHHDMTSMLTFNYCKTSDIFKHVYVCTVHLGVIRNVKRCSQNLGDFLVF